MLSEELLDNLLEGLYLAGVGMGLVFASLTAFFLVLIVIRRLYPEFETDSVQESNLEESEDIPSSTDPATNENQQDSTLVYPNGEKIAAMAVAVYMQMEEEQAMQQLIYSGGDNPSHQSSWRLDGRNAMMSTQGHRPTSYGERSLSDPKNRRGN